jgi:high-affinity iron transporter
MLGTLIIVFREILEAGLIVGIVMAATRGVPRRGWWVGYGVGGGVVGACLVALFAGAIASLFAGSGQELFNAAILILAVGMLTWHNVWMASHGRDMSKEMRRVGAEVAGGERSLLALSIVVGVAVLREGSELVLFLYGVAASGGTSAPAMLAGGALGLLAGAGVSAAIYFGLASVPMKQMFAVTTALITLLAAGLASQAVAFLQQAGYLVRYSTPLWDTSAYLPETGILGRLLRTLIGYTDQPNGAQLIAYLAVIGLMVVMMRLQRKPAAPAPARGEARSA